jgi:thiamine-phosphate pyrophosphorylase
MKDSNPMNNLNSAQEVAEAIARVHASMLAGEARPYAGSVQAQDQGLSPQAAGIVQGARMLGFVEHDAQCLSKAWQAQSLRIGHFAVEAWPDHPQDFGIAPWPRSNAFPSCPKSLGLYAVLPDAQWIARMAQAGVLTLQLRFKSSDAAAVTREVRAAVKAVQGTQSLLFINDYWQVAIDEGAYGVHLGQEDMEMSPIETIRASGLRLGLSTHGYVEMLRAEAHSPSYLALGAVFPTTLKRMQTAPQGTGRLGAYAKLMAGQSLVAIGGIDSDRVAQVMSCGVGSIAVVRAITGASDPEKSAAQLSELMIRA